MAGKPVNTRVSNLAVTREGYNMKANWRVPAEMVDSANPRKADWIDIEMDFYKKGVDKKKHVKPSKGVGNPKSGDLPINYTNADFFWIRGQGTGDEVIKNFDRTRYHPCIVKNDKGKVIKNSLNVFCEKVKVGVWGGRWISPNKGGNGITVWATYKFGLPRAPKVTWSYEIQNATVTVETDPGEDNCERYDTYVCIDYMPQGAKSYRTVYASNGSRLTKNETYKSWFSTKSTKFEATFDVSKLITDLQNNKVVRLRCRAYARGMAGNNPEASKPKVSELVIALPTKATIGTVSVDQKRDTETGALPSISRIKIPITVGSYTDHVQLQRRHGPNGSWEDVEGASDNGSCKALYDSYGAALPVAGEYIYYRVKSSKLDTFHEYSGMKRADCLYTAKAKTTCTASMEILSMTQTQRTIGGNVEIGVYVRMAFTDTTSNTGCELSWSEYPNAWNSNNPPNTVQVTGKDSAETTALYTKKYKNTKGTNVYGLTPGTTYYFRMRRYRIVDGETYYSAYETNINEVKSITAEGADANDKCWIESAEAGSDGASVALTVRFKEDNVNTGTEVSWSKDKYAWKSNEQPSTMEVTWKTAQESGGWTHVQDIYLRGLERGTKYYAYARRYQDHSGGRSYAPYSKQFSFTTPQESTASADVRCGLVSVEPSGGTGAVVVIGWDGNHTGCEASWSKDQNAWESSTAPSTFEFDWQDSWNKSGFKTEDESIDDSKDYYTRTGGGTDESPYVYEKVTSPVVANLGSYYEVPWSNTSTCYIADLEEGSTYYVKARSYYDGGDDKKWSDYTPAMTVTPYAAPNSVTLDAPSAVARGDAIELYWSVDSEMEQTEWHVHDSSNPGRALAAGTGSLCYASIPPEVYDDATSLSIFVDVGCGGGLTTSNIVPIDIVETPTCDILVSETVDAQPASFEVYSDRADVRVLATCRADGITVSMPDGEVEQLSDDVVWTSTITTAFTATTWGETDMWDKLSSAVDNAEDAVVAPQAAFDATDEAIALVAAQAAFDATSEAIALAELEPGDDGYEEAYKAAWSTEEAEELLEAKQTAWTTSEGEALSSAMAALAAAQNALDSRPENGEVFVATINMPVIDLYDGGGYSLSVQTVESIAGLVSAAIEARFSVAYEHQAPDPSDSITLEPDSNDRSVKITLVAPSGSEASDVYDVYRMTQDGFDLVRANAELDAELLDVYAPYGNIELAYRICCRTADGDISFRDYPYEMNVKGARIDWSNTFVDLPFNIEFSNSYTKSFEARAHVDGSVNGYFDRAVKKSGSMSADIVKLVDHDKYKQLLEMGQHPGACFLRTDKGHAIQCNCEVSDIGYSYNSASVPVKLSVEYMKLTDVYMIGDGYYGPNEEGESNG